MGAEVDGEETIDELTTLGWTVSGKIREAEEPYARFSKRPRHFIDALKVRWLTCVMSANRNTRLWSSAMSPGV